MMDSAVAVSIGGMSTTPPRPRMIFDCPERMRRAIKIRAAKTGISPSDVVVRILEASLANELREADENIANETEPPKSRRGRKRKAKE